MSSGGGTQSSLRKTLGALKDTTTLSLAKMISDYKNVDIAIVKATNHVESPPKERHVKAVFAALSATRPRADVGYCIHALTRRLAKTHNWAVALKTLIVIHRALREVDPTFHEEITNYARSRKYMLYLAHFKDDSSPNAWEYSAWLRCYALFLEERLECFRVLKYDIETDRPRTRELDTPDLLEHLPALQQLLHRAINCQPRGAAYYNFIIQLALSMVASESIKIYNAISDGTVNLVDKFFEMQRPDALKSLEIYRIAIEQAERLPDFYGKCKNLERFNKIEQPPASVLQAMEEYIREAHKELTYDKPKEILASQSVKEESHEAELVNIDPPASKPPPPPPPPNLMGFNEPAPAPAAAELEEKKAMALAVVPVEQQASNGPNVANGATGWELALVTAPSSNGTTSATNKLAGGLDLFTLDSLYEDAIIRNNPNVSYNPWEQPPKEDTVPPHDPFSASNAVAAPLTAVKQQQPMMLMGQQQAMNPFGSAYITPHTYGAGIPVQAYNPYSGLI